MKKLLRIVKRNAYIKKYKKNVNKDFNSLSYLIKKEYSMSQSDCIKLGIAVEKILTDVILSYKSGFLDIKSKNIKNKHERDHLFINEDSKTLVYSELKSNLNLDTEKSKSTVSKCLKIVKELKKEFPGYEIKWGLLGLRYNTKDIIQHKILCKYFEIENNVLGVNEYLDYFNIDLSFDEDEYTEFLNTVVKTMFKQK